MDWTSGLNRAAAQLNGAGLWIRREGRRRERGVSQLVAGDQETARTNFAVTVLSEQNINEQFGDW